MLHPAVTTRKILNDRLNAESDNVLLKCTASYSSTAFVWSDNSKRVSPTGPIISSSAQQQCLLQTHFCSLMCEGSFIDNNSQLYTSLLYLITYISLFFLQKNYNEQCEQTQIRPSTAIHCPCRVNKTRLL